MIRGTTPTHIFHGIPVLSTEIEQIWITYQQAGRAILTKDKTSVVFDDNFLTSSCSASVTLSQEDTLSFRPGKATVQIRVCLFDGTAMASGETLIDVGRITKYGEIY